MTDDQQTTWDRFHDTVNMTARELEKWLGTEESKSVGQKQDGDESTGHASGRHIVEILKAKRADLTDADYARMRKVVGYAKRHLAATPGRQDRRQPVAILVDELGPRPREVPIASAGRG